MAVTYKQGIVGRFGGCLLLSSSLLLYYRYYIIENLQSMISGHMYIHLKDSISISKECQCPLEEQAVNAVKCNDNLLI